MVRVPSVSLWSSLSGSVISYICICSSYVQWANILVASKNCFLLYAFYISVHGALLHIHVLFQENSLVLEKTPKRCSTRSPVCEKGKLWSLAAFLLILYFFPLLLVLSCCASIWTLALESERHAGLQWEYFSPREWLARNCLCFLQYNLSK